LKESGSGVKREAKRAAERDAEVDIAPEPVWDPVAEVVPPQIPNWEPVASSKSKAEAWWDHPSDPALPQGTMHTPAGRHRGRRRHSRTVIAVAALACLVVVFLAATAILTSLHHSTPANAGPPATSAPKVSHSLVTPQVRAATEATLTAGTSVRQALDSLSGIPTTTKVVAIINPYISTLQQYRTFLANSTVPVAARAAKSSADTLVTQDLQFLGTINGLPSLRLGSYLEQFGSNSTALHTALTAFERTLRAPTN
jgi:hypothetical protein